MILCELQSSILHQRDYQTKELPETMQCYRSNCLRSKWPKWLPSTKIRRCKYNRIFPLNIPWTISRVQEWKFCITFLNDSIQPTFEFNIVNAFQSVDIRRNINFVLTSLISFKNWSSPQLPDASFTGLHIFQISFYWTCKTCQLIFLPNDSHPTLDISRSNSFILPTMQSIIGRNWKGVGSNEMQYLFNDSAFSVS